MIRNPEEVRITAPARFDAPVDPDRQRQLLAKLDERAGTQRGKPRSRDPKKNPLGSRAFDMNCGWPLYRQPYGKRFRYLCGLYQQSHGAECSHNHVDGLTTTRFVLSCVRQRALSPRRLQRLESRIRQLAATERPDDRVEREISRMRARLSQAEEDRDQAAWNLTLAKNNEQRQAIEAVFNQLAEQVKSIKAEIAEAEQRVTTTNDVDSAVETAMGIIGQLTELANGGEDLGAARQVFDMLNARLFLGFRPVQVKKRMLNKITGGVVTFGDTPPPIKIYEGPTARKKLKSPAASSATGPGERHLPSPPERSIGSGEGASR